ncbi:MAG: cytochrome O ubiquinol oxidase [Acidiferrobacter sp.]
MSHGVENPLDHPEVRLVSGRGYFVSYALSVLLMAFALAFATHPNLVPSALMGLATVGAIATVAQILLLFRLNFSETQIWSTVSFVLVVPLFVIAVGLTMWMFNSLDARTMIPGLMH